MTSNSFIIKHRGGRKKVHHVAVQQCSVCTLVNCRKVHKNAKMNEEGRISTVPRRIIPSTAPSPHFCQCRYSPPPYFPGLRSTLRVKTLASSVPIADSAAGARPGECSPDARPGQVPSCHASVVPHSPDRFPRYWTQPEINSTDSRSTEVRFANPKNLNSEWH